jgi:hypothetical protein
MFRFIQSQIEFSLVKRNISTIASLQLITFPHHRRDNKQPYWRPYADATRLQDAI